MGNTETHLVSNILPPQLNQLSECYKLMCGY